MLRTGKKSFFYYMLESTLNWGVYFRRLTTAEDMPMENQPWTMQPRASSMEQRLQLGIEGAQLKWSGHLMPTTEVRVPQCSHSWSKKDSNVFLSSFSGGYAYRLCKVPAGGISQVTEKCFQNGHLSFSGVHTWIWKKGDSRRFTGTKWKRQRAMRTRKGTTPSGSQWAKINLPSPPAYSNSKGLWAFKDNVQVPASLEPGPYVLSFRWDAQNSPQVWNSCSNINIV